jgi:phospholipid/cholesterol/gamma-HCH transport system substrate-binding protein
MEKKKQRNLIALGGLTVLATIIFFWLFFYLLGSPVLQGGMDIVLLLDNGGGLKRSDRVQVQGVQVGRVQNVALSPSGNVIVDVRLQENVELPSDTRALVSGDVFGAGAVDLVPGQSLVMLEKGDTIRGTSQGKIGDIAAGLSARVGAVLASADSLLSPAAVANIHATAAMLPASAQELRAALVEARAASAALRRMAQNLEAADAGPGVKRAIAEVESTARALNAATARIDQSLVRLDQSLVSMQSVFGKIDSGNGTLGRLVNDSSVYVEMNHTLREIRALATDIRERPSRYINLKIF